MPNTEIVNRKEKLLMEIKQDLRKSYSFNIFDCNVLGTWVPDDNGMSRNWYSRFESTTLTKFIEDVITENKFFTYPCVTYKSTHTILKKHPKIVK